MSKDSDELRAIKEYLMESLETKTNTGYYITLACFGLGIVGLILIAVFPEQALSIFVGNK